MADAPFLARHIANWTLGEDMEWWCWDNNLQTGPRWRAFSLPAAHFRLVLRTPWPEARASRLNAVAQSFQSVDSVQSKIKWPLDPGPLENLIPGNSQKLHRGRQIHWRQTHCVCLPLCNFHFRLTQGTRLWQMFEMSHTDLEEHCCCLFLLQRSAEHGVYLKCTEV